MKTILIGLDFSINKPAMTVYYEGKYYHYFWPTKLPKKATKLYKLADVTVYNRNLDTVTKKNTESSLLVLTHTIRSTELCNKIIEDINDLIFNKLNIKDNYNLYICSEGLSFGSKGDATLNLATYKGVLLSKLYEEYNDHLKGLFTYPPISIKSTAECATKELISDKINMINKYMQENNDIKLRLLMVEGKMKNKTNFIKGIDDIVDSYWALLTMIKKEEIPI